jgi:hypothetical protein
MSKEELKKIKTHLFKRIYMSSIERERNRVKVTAEVFTPDDLATDFINKFPEDLFKKNDKTFLDNCCGDGQLLSVVLYKKIKNSIDFETALSTIYGVDLMPDNVKLCQDRLLCGRDDLRHIVEQNIVCADALTYHYRFDGTDADVTDHDLQLENLGFEFS